MTNDWERSFGLSLGVRSIYFTPIWPSLKWISVIVAPGLGLWAYDNFTATPVRPLAVPPPSVAVAAPVQANVADRTDLTGQFSAVNQVVLRAQVSPPLPGGDLNPVSGSLFHYFPR